MATVTVQSLIDRAITTADMHDNFVDNAEWLVWANQYYKELCVMIAQQGVPYLQYDEAVTCTGATEYTITEPLAVMAVYRYRSDGSYFKLKPRDSVQKVMVPTSNPGEPTHFYIRRDTAANTLRLQFYPNPTSGTVFVRAIEYPKNLVLTGAGGDNADTIYLPLGWEEYIVLKMALAALDKEETINPRLDRRLAETIEHIEFSGRKYILNDVQKIRDWREDNWSDTEWLWM